MSDIYKITDIEQLKVISDPIRIKIVWEIIDHAKTGKMIADILEMPASKIHYHLKELERVGLIKVVRTEEKNGIIQKFYQCIASQFTFDDILPQSQQHSVADSLRENITISLNKTVSLIKKTEDDYLEDYKNQLIGNLFAILDLTEDELKVIKTKWKDLVETIQEYGKDEHKENAKSYHINMVGFPIEKTEDESEG
ncbi:helix-turn-helix domain-containing protein [Alkalihalobacillus sp. LMS39]|uniref:ArsR/SmtB family transcription factor n=1 Tax=Alkalihalobacillus sp. LMS39 TaxID=2924032 RepID=UPI001FB1D1B0|nr:helix-turn-helix domain-containing protein [Alkalihalobacillus sp. LMS39]UOE96152.1 helix-turn-helix domain-containing protein [Alkalihalobacillus sp. LMS39]